MRRVSQGQAVQRGGAVAALVIACALLVAFASDAQKKREPLSKAEIVDLLKSDVSPKRVEALAHDFGIAFQVSHETEDELRAAGATEAFIATLRELAPKPPVLMIESTPGGAQVFIDDELIARTSPEGRLKISNLTAGQHRLRVSLEGYHDYQETTELTAGQTAQVAARLESAKPAITPPKAEVTRPPGVSTGIGVAAKEVRWHGTLIQISKDTSSIDVRKGTNEKKIYYDSSTKWTKGTTAVDMSEFKEGSEVICLGKYDEKGAFRATRIDLRR